MRIIGIMFLTTVAAILAFHGCGLKGGFGDGGGIVNATWSSAAATSTKDASHPQAAVDSDGNAIIVWDHHDINHNILKAEYRGGAWTFPYPLNTSISPGGSDATSPRVAMDASGNAIIAWAQDGNILKSEYRGGAWTHPGTLANAISPGGSVANFPQVAMDGNGNAIITWEQNGYILKSEYHSGAWTHPGALTNAISPTGSYANSPQAAMDGNGNAIITWAQNGYILKSEYRGGAWKHPGALTNAISPTGSYANSPQAAMDGSGNSIITWAQGGNILKSEYRGGVWRHPGALANAISPTGSDASSPQVAMDASGNAIITWMQDATKYYVLKSEYRGGVWRHPGALANTISLDVSLSGTYPQVAMDGNGDAIITWEHFNGSSFYVYKSEYRNGAWTNPATLANTVNSSGSYGSPAPRVAMGGGSAVITWAQFDSGNFGYIYRTEYR